MASTFLDFINLPKSDLERIEMPEQLRLVENGLEIHMEETVHKAIAIDSTEDLTSAEAS